MAPGSLLRQARISAGLTQRSLAERLGVSQPTLARLESVRANPKIDTLRRAIRATGHELELTLGDAAATVDETLIASSLRLPPATRLERFSVAYRNTARLARKANAGREG
jgi:transcriptional regulator with XRE-family HTH domain